MAPIRIVESDRAWPREFEKQAVRIREALGERVLLLEHVGSTSVPGLAAKPVVDILLAVANSADEDAYRPALENAGFALTIREPGWHEHRMLKGTVPDTKPSATWPCGSGSRFRTTRTQRRKLSKRFSPEAAGARLEARP